MNTENLKYLQKGLKNTGFGDTLNAELEARIKDQPAEFAISFSGEFKRNGITEKADYELNFKKSDKTDMYFFNRYKATLKGEDAAADKTQTFYITKNFGVTAKEAYNLLSGRAVNKDLTTRDDQKYNAWLQLDFTEKDKNDNFKVKQFHSGYGYDLEAALAKYPIKELSNPEDKERLLKSLQKGNVHQVTFDMEGKQDRMHVAANPQFKSLHLYDAKLQKVYQGVERKESKVNEEQSNGQGKSDKKESQKQDTDVDGDGKQGQKSTRKRGIGI